MENSQDLFDRMPMLSWLPDETLFSLVSRHHFFWGHRQASRTNMMLFGCARGGTHHDFPSCLDEFAKRSEERFGGAIEVSKERTLLRYYRKFMDPNAEERAVTSLRSSSVADLKFRMGILTSRFRANHPLKACSACMEDDRKIGGWAYWHLDHQFPGVWVCQKHGCLLVESDLKASGVERFLWHLPDADHFRSPRSTRVSPGDTFRSLSRISDMAIDLVRDTSLPRIDVGLLHQAYRAEIGKRDLLTSRGSFRLSELSIQFHEHVRPLREQAEFVALPATVEEAYSQLSRHLRTPRNGTHPVRHIVLIEWLFGSYGRFLDTYKRVGADEQCHFFPRAADGDFAKPENKKLMLARLLKNPGVSVRAAAADLEIATATAMVWAAELGIEVSRRPKKLKSQLRESLIARLEQGADKATLAAEFEISIVTVTHVLRTHIGLHTMWKNARYERAKNNARAAWTMVTSTNARLGVKLLRHMQPSAYAWLYRNDRRWLSEHSIHCLKSVRRDSVPRTKRWELRDVELCASVEQIALRLFSEHNGGKVMLWHLYQAIPELKAKLSALSRLPLTVRAIERALNYQIQNNNPQLPLRFEGLSE